MPSCWRPGLKAYPALGQFRDIQSGACSSSLLDQVGPVARTCSCPTKQPRQKDSAAVPAEKDYNFTGGADRQEAKG